MTIIYSASPGSASKTFAKNLEKILKCKSCDLNSGGGFGQIIIKIPTQKKILNKLRLNFLYNPQLIYSHLFPTKYNLDLLNYHYKIKHFIVSYRNIYDQLNYYYKWQKYKKKGPLNFQDDVYFTNDNQVFSQNFNIDLNLLLVLNFYKHWFYLIQNNKIKNVTLFSFKEIISLNKDYVKKIKYVFNDLVDVNQIKFDKSIVSNLQEKEQFEINPRHKKLIDEFISFHKEVDFSLLI